MKTCSKANQLTFRPKVLFENNRDYIVDRYVTFVTLFRCVWLTKKNCARTFFPNYIIICIYLQVPGYGSMFTLRPKLVDLLCPSPLRKEPACHSSGQRLVRWGGSKSELWQNLNSWYGILCRARTKFSNPSLNFFPRIVIHTKLIMNLSFLSLKFWKQ